MAASTVPLSRDAAHVGALLDSPEIVSLIAELEATWWTGRPDYPIRAMVGLSLVKGVYALPTWTRTVALVRDHAGLRDVLGAAPSVKPPTGSWSSSAPTATPWPGASTA